MVTARGRGAELRRQQEISTWEDARDEEQLSDLIQNAWVEPSTAGEPSAHRFLCFLVPTPQSFSSYNVVCG